MCGNVRIKAEIARRRAKIEKKANITRELQLTRLDTLLNMAITQKNVTAGKAVIAEQNEMLGYHRELAPNAEKEAIKHKRSAQEDRLAKEYAIKRTAELAQKDEKPNIKLRTGTNDV